MEDKYISYIAHEGIVTRMERQSKRLFILCFVLILALIGSNFGWIIYENQFEDVTTEVTQETQSDGDGDAIIYGDHAGAVIYGESKTDDQN